MEQNIYIAYKNVTLSPLCHCNPPTLADLERGLRNIHILPTLVALALRLRHIDNPPALVALALGPRWKCN